MQRFTRSIPEIWKHWEDRINAESHPFTYTTPADNKAVFAKLTSLDHDAWAKAYSEAAQPYEEKARAAEANGDDKAACENFLHAYGLYRMGRYPAPNSEGKKAAYRKSQEMLLASWRYMPYDAERVEMPFRGRAGEGKAAIGYLFRPKGAGKLPVVQVWGGIDTFKEDRYDLGEALIAQGMAALLIDMPGVGDAPIPGSEDAERMWDAVFGWIATRSDLDAKRVAIWGGSTGGYWGAKVAHTHKDRLVCAVDHGGCTHYAFTPEWIEKAQHGSYAFELAETLASAFGRSTLEEWVAYCPKLSLLDQGVLDGPCAPLLLVNGVNDTTFPIQDMYVLLEHGDPKAAQFYPSGHMGHSPTTIPTIVSWLKARLGA